MVNQLYGKKFRVKSVLNGIKLTVKKRGSYTCEILLYLSGPCANIVACLLALPYSLKYSSFNFLLVNLTTAISNLLPIEGYDGYGAIRCLLEKKESGFLSFALLDCLSATLIFSLCTTSLYLIDRHGEGYWIFFLFLTLLTKSLSKLLKSAKRSKKEVLREFKRECEILGDSLQKNT